MVSYFGHSSNTSLDFNLDDPNKYSNAGCAIKVPMVNARINRKRIGAAFRLLAAVMPFIRARSMLRMMSPMKIPKRIATIALSTTVEKK